MAAALPDIDLTTLTSSAQIFSSNPTGSAPTATSYTLPQIRTLHKQIHVAIDDKKARLRTQVGGSYRELLGTADAIVRMRTDMEDVQGILGTMGARCGRGVVGGKVGGLAKFSGDRESALGDVGRAKLLAGCGLALSKILKKRSPGSVGDSEKGDQLVLAAKVLVLGRLLVKSAEAKKPAGEAHAAFETSAQSLERLRRRLRKSIDLVLGAVGETTNCDMVLKALCAYSLVTNAGARDVIRHFLDVRGTAMALVFDVDEHRTTMDVVKGLELYTKTILDVQYLVPNKLTEALAHLKKETLLSDPSLRDLEGLRLDIYERWCNGPIQNFRPTIRHDDLDGKQAVEMLRSWSSKGSEVLLQGLEKTLERTTEFKAIMDMRTEVLQLWIRDGGKARGFDPSTMLDNLRQTINKHVMGVLDAKVHKLRLVGSEVSATLDVWRAGVTDKQQSLWDSESLDMDLHHGAGPFAQDVIGRLYGRNDAVARAVTGYKSWAGVIDDVESVVEQLKKQRWDTDVDEIEDEETIEQRQQALSRDDPAKLQERLDVALEKAFQELDQNLSGLWEKNKDSGQSGKIAMYLLRTLRDIRAKLPKLATVRGFGLAMVPSLQEKTASTVVVSPVDDFASNALTRKMVVGRSLWDGSPELPTSPSPAVFRLLRNLTRAMGDAGTDLWSPAAVLAVKRRVGRELAQRWTYALDALVNPAQPEADAQAEPEGKEEDEKPAANAADDEAQQGENDEKAESEERGSEEKRPDAEEEREGKEKQAENDEEAESEGKLPDAEDEENKEKQAEKAQEAAAAEKAQKDLLVQWLFDIATLRCALSQPDATTDELRELEELVGKKADVEPATARQRLNKASQEYWKRSSLLFGVLG